MFIMNIEESKHVYIVFFHRMWEGKEYIWSAKTDAFAAS